MLGYGYSFTKHAWIILAAGATVVGIILAYIFAPKISSIKDQQDNPNSTLNYQIPVPENLQIPARPLKPDINK